jgi:transposase
MEEVSQVTMIEQYLSGAARLRDICERFKIHRATVWRKIRRFRESGREGLVHKLRGRPSNNGKPAAMKEQIRGLYAQYKPLGFNPWRFYHQVVRQLPEFVSFSTVRRWLRKEDT